MDVRKRGQRPQVDLLPGALSSIQESGEVVDGLNVVTLPQSLKEKLEI